MKKPGLGVVTGSVTACRVVAPPRSRLHSPYDILAGENISARFVVPTVAASVDLVVHLGLDPRGGRHLQEIVAVPGRVEADIIETEAVFERVGGELRRGAGLPPRQERFERIGVDVVGLLGAS